MGWVFGILCRRSSATHILLSCVIYITFSNLIILYYLFIHFDRNRVMLKNATRNITFIVLIVFSLASTYWYRDYVILKLEQFCQWVDSLGRVGYLILGLADLIGVVICFPFTIAFEIAAGFLFQFTYGYVPLE